MSNVPAIRNLMLHPFPTRPLKSATILRVSGSVIAVVQNRNSTTVYSTRATKNACYMPSTHFADQLLKHLVPMGVISKEDYKKHLEWAKRSEDEWERAARLKRLQETLQQLGMKPSPEQAKALRKLNKGRAVLARTALS